MAAKMEGDRWTLRLRPKREKTTTMSVHKMSPAERAQRWRDGLKNDPVRYQQFKENDRIRKQKYRRSRNMIISDEQKQEIRRKNRERQRKFQERRKALKIKDSSPKRHTDSSKRRILTRKERSEKQAYWRIKQRESRLRRSSQKIRRKKEKDREYLKRKKTCMSSPKVTQNTPNKMSSAAVKKAVQRSKKNFPKHPENFAEVMNRILTNASKSPRKKAALEAKGVLISDGKKCSAALVDVLKRQVKDRKVKRTVISALKVMKKYRMLKSTSLCLGVQPSTVSRFQDNQERKSRKDIVKDNDTKNFFMEVGVTVPDRKSVKAKEERKILDRPLTSVYKEYKESGGSLAFSTFAKKKPKNVFTSNKQPWYSCLCEYCTNVDLKLKSLNTFASKVKMPEKQILDHYTAVNITLCKLQEEENQGQKFHKKECIERTCQNCNSDLFLSNLSPLLLKHGCKSIDYTEWEKQEGLNKKGTRKTRMMMVRKTSSLNAMTIKLKENLETLAKHLFVARWQQQQFTKLTSQLPKDWVVLNLDFSENYTCISQMEIQTAHWGHNQATIHPIVSYYKCNKDGCEMTDCIQETLVFISDDLTHDRHAVHCFVKKANEHLQRRRSLNIEREIHFSDGCAGLYKACSPFCDISFSQQDYGFKIERHFYGSRHGKGPSDGAGAVIKHGARRAVNCHRALINDAKDLAEFAKENMTKDDEEVGGKCTHIHRKRTIFFVTSEEIDRNREDRTAKTIPGTRQMHCVRAEGEPRKISFRNLSCFCKSCTTTGGLCENAKYVDPYKQIRLLRIGESSRGVQGNSQDVRGAGTANRRMRGQQREVRVMGGRRAGVRTRGGGRAGVRTRGGGRAVVRTRGGRTGIRIRGGERTDMTRGGGRGARASGGERGARIRGGRRAGVRTRGGRRGRAQSFSSSESEESEMEFQTSSEECSEEQIDNSSSDYEPLEISGLSGILKSLEDQEMPQSPIFPYQAEMVTEWDISKMVTELEQVETATEFDNGLTATEFDNGETAIEFDNGETATEFDNGETTTEFDNGETATECDQGETATGCDKDIAATGCDTVETATECDQSETTTGCDKGETGCDKGETATEFDNGETATGCDQGETATGCDKDKTATECDTVETATECDQGETTTGCDKGETGCDKGETATEFDNGETATGCDQGETATEFDNGETATGCDQGETATGCDKDKAATECDTVETATECDQGETTTGCDKGETGCDKGETATGCDKGETATGCDKGETATGCDKGETATGCDKGETATGCDKDGILTGFDEAETVTRYDVAKTLTGSNQDDDQMEIGEHPRSGQFLQIAHGKTIYPAVVDKWPFVIFYKNAEHGWVEGDIRHSVLQQDVVGNCKPPSVFMRGSRIFYKFNDVK